MHVSSSSFSFGGFHPVLDTAAGFARPARVEYAKLFAGQLVIIDEELLKFAEKFFTEIVDVPHECVTVVGLLDSDDTIIAQAFFLIELLSFDDTDQTAFQEAAREGGFVHENEDVHRIAVFGKSGGNEPEVIRKAHSGRQNFFELKDFLIWIEAVFVAATFGGLNDDVDDVVVVGIARFQDDGIGKTASSSIFGGGILRHMVRPG
jgi:hypothetical protein